MNFIVTEATVNFLAGSCQIREGSSYNLQQQPAAAEPKTLTFHFYNRRNDLFVAKKGSLKCQK